MFGVVIGGAVAFALAVRCLRVPKAKVFDPTPRTDMSGKAYAENSFAYLNRSARPGSAVSRELIEAWLSRVPEVERGGGNSQSYSLKSLQSGQLAY